MQCGGRPPTKAAEGTAAQEDARQVNRLRHGSVGERQEAAALLAERVAGERRGAPISEAYAQRQAKSAATDIFANAGSLTDAAVVLGRLLNMPEVRVAQELLTKRVELPERALGNVVSFIYTHFSTEGTRHAEDQNAHDVILTAVVDGMLEKDRLIDAFAKMLGVSWAAVKRAILRRVKRDDEALERTEFDPRGSSWKRVVRSTRCDKYELPGFIAFMHDDTIFRFCSRRSTPLRKHIAIGVYEIHWAREVPNEMKDVVFIYLYADCAKKYREMDLAANDGNLPEDSLLNANICFCLIKPTYDQCADPIYTPVRANLPTYHKLRTSWHQKESACDMSCACKSKLFFLNFSSSEDSLNEWLLCPAIACPELKLEDESEVPKLHKPCCTLSECNNPGCLAAKLEEVRECKIEFAETDKKVRFRKYAKMPRKRNDGTEYTETEFVYVEETETTFVSYMLSAIEKYLEHRRAHLWVVRQRELLMEKLKHAPSFEQLAIPGRDFASLEAKMRWLNSLVECGTVLFRTISGHDILIFTDYAARVKYENASSSTCEHPNQGTMCIAVVLHSPAKHTVRKDVTEKKVSASAGLEGVAVSDESKAPQRVEMGKRTMVDVEELKLQCDVFCGYSEESGHARFDQTFMRDIIAYYKLGHLVYATAGTHCGEPIPIGKDTASAKPSEYDQARRERLGDFNAHQQTLDEAEALVRQQREAEAEAAAAGAPAPAEAEKSSAKVLKKRKSAGKSKATATATADGGTDDEPCRVSTDRRGMLKYMRLLLKWTDRCGVQYVQREAALGTASLYDDIQELAKDAEDPAAAFGVIGLHTLFEPHCFKYIHDAAGKVFVDYKNKGVMGRKWTISNIYQHYDFNAAYMLEPNNGTFNFGSTFEFFNYYHVLYKSDDFVKLPSDAVEGIKSWALTEGGTDTRNLARGGSGGGFGYSFRSQTHVCFCGCDPCPHINDFTGEPEKQKVYASTQETVDREQATSFFATIKADMPLASKGDLEDSTAGGEPLWVSIAKDTIKINEAPFKAAGGIGPDGTRTINANWAYVDVQYLEKMKTDSEGNVHFEAWTQPQGQRTVLTKPKILTVAFDWLRIDSKRNAKDRYVMRAADYQRLTDAVKPRE